MKRLILIQNDASGTGKTTLTRCIERYLTQHGVSHQAACLIDTDEEIDFSDRLTLQADSLTGASFLEFIDQEPITLIEIDTGLGSYFAHFYQSNDFDNLLSEAGFELSVVLPVTGEVDTFESVIRAAEVYSDAAEYTIAHLVTSAYNDDEDQVWDRSYAARVMDMFEAVELYVPEIGFQLEMELRNHHMELGEALGEPAAEDIFGREFSKWLQKSMAQVESARQYLFGDAFVPTSAPPTPKKATRRRAKAK